MLQPKYFGDAVGLTTTGSFLSLIVWAFILGPIGAILAIPASLFFKALPVDMNPTAQWLDLFLGDKPMLKERLQRHWTVTGSDPDHTNDQPPGTQDVNLSWALGPSPHQAQPTNRTFPLWVSTVGHRLSITIGKQATP